MPYKFLKYNHNLNYFAIYNAGFNCEEVEIIKDLEELQTFKKAGVGSSNLPPTSDVRDSEVAWINHDNHSDWLFQRLSQITGKVNYDHFLYEIEGLDTIQYTKYSKDQHYTWHWDLEFGWQEYERKISFTVCLSDPDEYTGGEFELCHNGNFEDTVKLKPQKGDIIYFASWMPHRVLPIVDGNRKSLVGWVMGKRQ